MNDAVSIQQPILDSARVGISMWSIFHEHDKKYLRIRGEKTWTNHGGKYTLPPTAKFKCLRVQFKILLQREFQTFPADGA